MANNIEQKTNYTFNQLWNIAKEKKIKYYKRFTKNQLEEILGFEISKPNEKYEKCCRVKIKNPIPIIAKNIETGETQNFKSIISAAKNFVFSMIMKLISILEE